METLLLFGKKDLRLIKEKQNGGLLTIATLEEGTEEMVGRGRHFKWRKLTLG